MSPEETWLYSDEGISCRCKIPMWTGMAPQGNDRVEVVRRTDGKLRVESNRELIWLPQDMILARI